MVPEKDSDNKYAHNPVTPEEYLDGVDGWKAYQQGGAFKVTAPADDDHPFNQPSRAVRGKIRRYSRQSAHRLRSLCNRIDHRGYAGALFLTLSFNEEHFPATAAEAHRKLDNFCKWLTRRFSDHASDRQAKEQKHAPILWRLEFGEKNGRPHFHLLVFASDWIDAATYADAWGQGFVKVKFADSGNVWRYIAKYVGKAEAEEQNNEEPASSDGTSAPDGAGVDGDAGVPVDLTPAHISPQGGRQWETTGRIWGIRNSDALIMAPLRWAKLDENDWIEERAVIILRRRMRSWQNSHRKDGVRAYWRQSLAAGCLEGREITDFDWWHRRRSKSIRTAIQRSPEFKPYQSIRLSLKARGKCKWLSHEDWRRWSVFVPQDWDLMGMLADIKAELRADARDAADGIYQPWKEATHSTGVHRLAANA